MPDRQMELEHLALADQHIAEGERRVTEQMVRVARLIDQGQGTSSAKDLLRLMEESMEQFYIHRGLILKALVKADLSARLSPLASARSKGVAMPGEPKIRGKINVVLNRLVREGVIAGFRTNFDVHDGGNGPHVTVTVPSGRSPDDVQMRVSDAIATVAIGINVIAERA